MEYVPTDEEWNAYYEYLNLLSYRLEVYRNTCKIENDLAKQFKTNS